MGPSAVGPVLGRAFHCGPCCWCRPLKAGRTTRSDRCRATKVLRAAPGLAPKGQDGSRAAPAKNGRSGCSYISFYLKLSGHIGSCRANASFSPPRGAGVPGGLPAAPLRGAAHPGPSH